MPPPPPPPLAQGMARPTAAAAAAGEDHATKDEARPAARCEICGSGENQHVMFSCIQCNGCQHRYCLLMVEFEMRYDWCCSECKKKADGDPKPIQGEKTEFQRPEKSHRNVAHQIGVKTPQIYENSKLKFIPCEEAALLSRERPAVHYTRRFVMRRSQSCSMKCVSPSRSDGQAFSLKRCAVASQNPIKADDTKKRQKVQSGAAIPMIPHNTKGEVTKIDQQLQDQPKEEKVANADRGKCNSWVDDQPTGKSALNASVLTDADSGCGSGTKSLHNNIDMPVIISSSAEYARRPPPEAHCWTGCFLLSDGESSNLGEFKAYFPSVVSSRVCNIAKKMPNNIQLKISPRMNYWPKTFDEFCPVYDDIALIFFSAELDCYNKKHPRRLEAYNSFVMKAYIDDIMLLIYSSEVLPPDSQWIDGESYLWGVFVKPKAKSNHAHLGSGAGSQFEGRLRTLHHMPQCSHYGTEASDWFNPLELLAEGSSNGPALRCIAAKVGRCSVGLESLGINHLEGQQACQWDRYKTPWLYRTRRLRCPMCRVINPRPRVKLERGSVVGIVQSARTQRRIARFNASVIFATKLLIQREPTYGWMVRGTMVSPAHQGLFPAQSFRGARRGRAWMVSSFAATRTAASAASAAAAMSAARRASAAATCELRWDFPEEESMMQYIGDKYFPQLRTKVINPVGEPRNT
uniref:Zinc finger PHD-type domain-containing protein n=1 Tax=Aegilops tauschii TaxID=37682 RepID=N1R4F4_AEGTA